ncbi:ChaN family lipoprotein [Sphingomonas sp. PL-96]|uniref:ChaN family lipoprotein n=1 Tax=Sphingomonas sp. PL-96 TaxID=2887201 RepID=UPI001E303AE5|nr:ChaN family lipoprotein [Sphingomonas sp. PL-96]MCC2977190.1 ChaN family lipoprotein [Sphingomonas sp. PL-96]
MLLTLLATTASALSCQPVDGFAEVVAASRARWIVAGERHGTNEMPAMFADLVCLASRAAPVVVAVEQPEQDQPAIDAYLNSDGGEEAEAAFLRATMWRAGQPDSVLDGRSSQAMFRLFRNLWEQHKHGRVVRVIAFEPGLNYKNGAFRMPWLDDKPVDQSDFEQRMAGLLQNSASGTGRMLVLTGSAHARQKPMDQFPNLRPMASFLPRDETLTLLLTSHGKGNAWNCLEAGCGVHQVEEHSPHRRGVVLERHPDQPFSGTVFLGTALTASTPQKSPSGSAGSWYRVERAPPADPILSRDGRDRLDRPS